MSTKITEFPKEFWLGEIRASEEFFERSTRSLTEEDSSLCPAPGIWTAAQQIAHVGNTIAWFIHGTFSGEGFDMNFEKHEKNLGSVTSIAAARKCVKEHYAQLALLIEKESPARWLEPIQPGPIMVGEPRVAMLIAVIEHTAHHRGALTIYTRAAGKKPRLPYMEMPA